MRTLVLLAVLCGLASSVPAIARAADVPVGCQNLREERAYLAGVQQGKTLVDRAWASVNNCDLLEHFSDIVTTNVESYTVTSSSAYVICRYSGLVDGTFERLDAVWTDCAGVCCKEGIAIGRLAADLYCQLSILLQGLGEPLNFVRKPVWTCGFEFQVCCDAEFMGYSQVYPASDPNVPVTPACLPYTVDSFASVWDKTRNVECAYTIPPAPGDTSH